jgi:hypothetical protein
MNSEEPLLHFSLAMYVVLAVFYTLLPILGGAKYGNLRPLYRIIGRLKSNPGSTLAVHLGALVVLITLILLSTRFYGALPRWLKLKMHTSGLSVLDAALIMIGLLLQGLESRWIANQSQPPAPAQAGNEPKSE